MDESEKDSASKIRKTVSLTHGQLGAGGAIIAALMVLQPLKDWVYTRDEANLQLAAQTQRIERIEVSLASYNEDMVRRLERNTDKIIERLKETEERLARSQGVIERRVESLEASRIVIKKGTINN